MSRKFSVSTMLRMTSNPILEKIFRQLGADTSPLEWDKIGKRKIAIIQDFYNELQPTVQDQVDLVLQDIYEIACDDGIKQIDEVSKMYGNEYWSLWFKKSTGIHKSFHSKAAWAWIMFPETFQKALEIFRLTHQTWWRPRTGLVRKVPTFDPTEKILFETAIRNHMSRRQCRGRYCSAAMMENGDGVYYFHVEISDYAKRIRVCTPTNEAKTEEFRSLCQIVYAYDSNTGTLRIRSGGTAKLKEELEEIFIRFVLGVVPIPLEQLCCDLQHLKSSTFSTATDMEDAVNVTIQQLVFQDCLLREISFNVPKKTSTVYQMIEDYFGHEGILARKVSVMSAKLRFEFLGWGECRKGSCTFEVRHGGSYSLKNQDVDRMEMIRKYMKQWRLENEHNTNVLVGLCREERS